MRWSSHGDEPDFAPTLRGKDKRKKAASSSGLKNTGQVSKNYGRRTVNDGPTSVLKKVPKADVIILASLVSTYQIVNHYTYS